jgi:DNA-binding MarR family transcriptional regulator
MHSLIAKDTLLRGMPSMLGMGNGLSCAKTFHLAKNFGREKFHACEILAAENFSFPESVFRMSVERATDWIEAVARLLPGIMRRLFGPPPEQSPLWDVPLPQMRVLHKLRCRGDLTMREVAGCLGAAMSTATQLADRLEGLGLVERRADAADRRVVRLALTAVGHAAIDELERQRNERIAAAMARLTPEECEAALIGLRLLERAARDVAPPLEHPERQPLWGLVAATLQPDAGERPG